MAQHANPEDIFLVQGQLDHQPVWYYVWVEKIKQPLLKKQREVSHHELEQLGRICYWGFGDEPPLHYREKVSTGDVGAKH